MEITEFLRARLSEDEDAARSAVHYDGPRTAAWSVAGTRRHTFDNGRHEDYLAVRCGDWDRILVARDSSTGEHRIAPHIARHDPARVLREVDAKRALIAEFADSGCLSCSSPSGGDVLASVVLTHLAASYSDHPDYRLDWEL